MKKIICVTYDQNYSLARTVANILEAPLMHVQMGYYDDGEIYYDIPEEMPENLSDYRVVIISPTYERHKNPLWSIGLLAFDLRGFDAQDLIWIIPYACYAREERKKNIVHTILAMAKETLNLPIDQDAQPEPRPAHQPSLNYIAASASASGIKKIVVIEPHTKNYAKAFTIPIIEVSVAHDIAQDIKKSVPAWQECCIVAPDQGAIARAQQIAQLLSLPLVVCNKERIAPDQVRCIEVKGYAGHTRAIMVDDIISTGNTALQAAQKLRELGVQKLHGYFVHGIFSHGVEAVLEPKLFTSLHISPTIPLVNIQCYDSVHYFDIESSLASHLEHLKQ